MPEAPSEDPDKEPAFQRAHQAGQAAIQTADVQVEQPFSRSGAKVGQQPGFDPDPRERLQRDKPEPIERGKRESACGQQTGGRARSAH